MNSLLKAKYLLFEYETYIGSFSNLKKVNKEILKRSRKEIAIPDYYVIWIKKITNAQVKE